LRRLISFVAACLLLQGWSTAHAANFCVSTPAQLATALYTAQSNGEDDDIRLVVGTYLLSDELTLAYNAASGEHYILILFGGYKPGTNCGTLSTTDQTVLDGQNQVRILTISAVGEVRIGNMTFQHANPSLYCGGAINVSNTDANTTIYYDTFVANKDQHGCGGALYISSTGTTIASLNNLTEVTSNLFIANTADSGGAAYLDAIGTTSYINGNTIVGNQGTTDPVYAGGLVLYSSATGDFIGKEHYYVSNNILWNNAGNDVRDLSGHVDYANNDIGARVGLPPLSISNELSVDPQFDGLLSVRPKPTSPLVNAGLDTAPGGIGNYDVSLATRLIGKHVDIGAYESDVLFRDGFGQ
jgi:hypothetical protein